MKGIKKISAIFISILICAFSAVLFTGCDEKGKSCKLYVFSTQGGHVLVDNNTDPIKFGDEGSKTFVYNKGDVVKLTAVCENGYDFVKWDCTDTLDQSVDLTDESIEFKINDSEVVIRANFALDGSVKYTISWETSDDYVITPEDGYSTQVDLRGDFKFKVTPAEGYDFKNTEVKANGVNLTPDKNGVYTITNISKDINITVGGQVKKDYKVLYDEQTIPGLTVIPESGYTTNVEHMGMFKFALDVRSDGYNVEYVKVYANGVELIADENDIYTISDITSNVNITFEYVEPVVESITYNFELQFTSDVTDFNYLISTFIPDYMSFIFVPEESGEITYSSNDESYQEIFEYSFDNENVTCSASEFEAFINNVLAENQFEDYAILCLAGDALGETAYITFEGDSFTVNWDNIQQDGNVYIILNRIN